MIRGIFIMADKTILNYVEQLYILESEQYTLEEMINSLKSQCANKKKQLQQESVSNNFDYAYWEQYGTKQSFITVGVVILVIGLIFLMYGLSVYTNYSDSSNMFSFTMTFLMCFVGVVMCALGVHTRDVKMQEAEQKKQEADNKVIVELNKIKSHNKEINDICYKLENTIRELERQLLEKKKSLECMYNCDIIHKSYRNFYGISKIFHLLDTGICSSLTGVDGAYSQMRTDQIIDNQKISISIQKELLATNQMMYSAINRTNDLLGTMNSHMNIQNINNAQLLQDVRDNIEVSNFLIQSSENDRKALVASSEYLAYAEKQKRIAEGHFY